MSRSHCAFHPRARTAAGPQQLGGTLRLPQDALHFVPLFRRQVAVRQPQLGVAGDAISGLFTSCATPPSSSPAARTALLLGRSRNTRVI